MKITSTLVPAVMHYFLFGKGVVCETPGPLTIKTKHVTCPKCLAWIEAHKDDPKFNHYIDLQDEKE